MADRKEKMKELTTRLEEGVKEIFEGGRYEEYLRVMSKFHRYSPRNTILIAMQYPEASMVAGFQSWKKNFGRHVKRGEKAIEILAPAPYKIKKKDEEAQSKDAGEEEIIINAFRPAYVFDVSQTEGKELQELAADISGDVREYNLMLEALKEASTVPISLEEMKGKDGFYSLKEKRIALRNDMSEVQTVAAAVHEISHAMLHDVKADTINEAVKELGKDSRTMEVEAESIAYVVSQYYGIETGENSFGYIASWSKDKKLPELYASLDTIRSTADEIISKVDKSLDKQKEERGEKSREKMMTVMEPSFYLPEGRSKDEKER